MLSTFRRAFGANFFRDALLLQITCGIACLYLTPSLPVCPVHTSSRRTYGVCALILCLDRKLFWNLQPVSQPYEKMNMSFFGILPLYYLLFGGAMLPVKPFISLAQMLNAKLRIPSCTCISYSQHISPLFAADHI